MLLIKESCEYNFLNTNKVYVFVSLKICVEKINAFGKMRIENLFDNIMNFLSLIIKLFNCIYLQIRQRLKYLLRTLLFLLFFQIIFFFRSFLQLSAILFSFIHLIYYVRSVFIVLYFSHFRFAFIFFQRTFNLFHNS